MDWKLEVVVVPVANIDRAKHFYHEQVGFVVDHDTRISDDVRMVQLTPPGSGCSIVIGVGMLRDAAADFPEVPAELVMEIEHLILSHHGAQELGSPVLPMTVEAYLLAAVDDLDAKLHQIHRHLAEDDSPGRFTSMNRRLDRVLFKPRST